VRDAGWGGAAVLHKGLHAIMDAAVRVYFRRIEARGLDRYPARGAVLVVANHPAAWTDALVLDVVFRRELHFVAHDELFHPWIRGVFLRLFASLPVRHRHEGPRAVALNRVTFDRCHTELRRGAAIAVFPEGVSGSDRELRPLKTGAARLVLEHVAAGDEAPVVLPVAIHYEDRTRFRTRVDLMVGPPVPVVAPCVEDAEPARHALTAEIARSLEAALVEASAHARSANDVPPAIASSPDLARVPAAFISSLALLGLGLHAPPALAIEAVSRRLAGLPQQISFGRMLSALVFLPVWYGVLVALAAFLGGGAWFTIPAAAPFLGLLACREIDRRTAMSAASRVAAGEGTA
jgi:1-acyl-sn-glycerol-3-phosphate acyltransferase